MKRQTIIQIVAGVSCRVLFLVKHNCGIIDSRTALAFGDTPMPRHSAGRALSIVDDTAVVF